MSPRAAVMTYLERIERVGPLLHAYLYVAADKALAPERGRRPPLD